MARLPQPSDVIAGKYTVERVLGQGGMGIVYVVTHCVTGKQLALKCLLPEFLHNPDIVERFVREAQATGRIQNRHVVDVFDVGRDNDVLFIVMELLDGKPLTELLRDERLTLEEALQILIRAMEGVAAAHAHGIVHRDLKPDNIFVCLGASGRLDDPRVLDFGISKVDDGISSLTRSGVAMGTPYYMALEQLSGLRDVDVRVDVYAMGVILYEAITGTPPHVADSVAALAIRLLTTEPAHLAEISPDLPPGLADVIMKSLARERENRYPTMQALIDAVRPFVPRGASVFVAEGSGRLLRTPRSSADRVRSGVTAINSTDGGPLFARTPASSVSTVPLAGQAPAQTPSGRPPITIVESRPRSRMPLLVAAAVAGAFVSAAAVVALRGTGQRAESAVPELPSSDVPALPAPPVAQAVPSIANAQALPLQVAAAQADAGNVVAEPVLLPAVAGGALGAGGAGAHGGQIADSSAHNAGTGKGRAGKKPRNGEGSAAAAGPQPNDSHATGPANPQAGQGARTGVTVTGRAGTLGSDDF